MLEKGIPFQFLTFSRRNAKVTNDASSSSSNAVLHAVDPVAAPTALHITDAKVEAKIERQTAYLHMTDAKVEAKIERQRTCNLEEQQYLDLVREVMFHGTRKTDRTGVGNNA